LSSTSDATVLPPFFASNITKVSYAEYYTRASRIAGIIRHPHVLSEHRAKRLLPIIEHRDVFPIPPGKWLDWVTCKHYRMLRKRKP
jgi:hypothetical protein